MLHSSGRSASELVAKDSVEWWILRCINWGFCFAVPCFLFVSAILWSRSQIARGSWNGYFKRRIKSILGPYVIWTGIYWLFRLLIEHSMLKPRESGGIVSRTQIPVRLYELFFGKAYFHLYFMFVLLQFALLFPLLYWLIKRSKIESFWLMCLIAVVVQYGVFYVYRSLYSPLYSLVVFRSPSSYILWYQTSIVPGIWIGLNWEKWQSIRDRALWIFAAVATPFLGGILLLESNRVEGTDISSYIYNGIIAVLAMAMGFSMLALCQRLRSSTLAYLGQISLQIYFIHPLIMFAMSRPSSIQVLKVIPISALWSFLLLIVTTVGVSKLLTMSKLDGVLFGRSPGSNAVRPSGASE